MSSSKFSAEAAYRTGLARKLKVDICAFAALCVTAGLIIGLRSELIGLNGLVLYAVIYLQPSWAERFCYLGTMIQVMVGEPMAWAAVAQPVLFLVQGIGHAIKMKYGRPPRSLDVYASEELAEDDDTAAAASLRPVEDA